MINERESLSSKWFALCAFGSVPVAKLGLLFWEHKLNLGLASFVEPVLVFMALVAAITWAAATGPSWVWSAIRVLAMLLWAGFIYVFVSFVPGCIWAPACL